MARPLGRDMGCFLWIQILIYTLFQPLQWCRQYHVILDCVIMVPEWPDCICISWHRSFSIHIVIKKKNAQRYILLYTIVAFSQYCLLHSSKFFAYAQPMRDYVTLWRPSLAGCIYKKDPWNRLYIRICSTIHVAYHDDCIEIFIIW